MPLPEPRRLTAALPLAPQPGAMVRSGVLVTVRGEDGSEWKQRMRKKVFIALPPTDKQQGAAVAADGAAAAASQSASASSAAVAADGAAAAAGASDRLSWAQACEASELATTANGDSDEEEPDPTIVGQESQETRPAGDSAKRRNDKAWEDAMPDGYRLPQDDGGPQLRQRADDEGNLSWSFHNYGALPASALLRQGVCDAAKKTPAQVIIVTECDQALEDALNTKGRPAEDAPAVAGGQKTLDQRPQYEYVTMRSREQAGVLVGVRASVGKKLDLLYWNKRFDGNYKGKSGQKQRRAYTRLMAVRVHTDSPVGHLGAYHNILVVHLHNTTAKKGQGAEVYADNWAEIASVIKDEKIQILAGDFNMSLFVVRPELAKHGVQVQLAAWYPWKVEGTGEPRADSVGIFFCEFVGEFKLRVGFDEMHSNGPNGFLFADAGQQLAAVAAEPGTVRYDRHSEEDGPGFPISSYLPNTTKNRKHKHIDVLMPTFQPHKESVAAVAARKDASDRLAVAQKNKEPKKTWPVVPPLFRCKHMNMNADLWKINGVVYRGSHMPICAGLNVKCHRSDVARQRRGAKTAATWWRKWDSAAVAADDGGADTAADVGADPGRGDQTDFAPRGFPQQTWGRSSGSDVGRQTWGRADWRAQGGWSARGGWVAQGGGDDWGAHGEWAPSNARESNGNAGSSSENPWASLPSPRTAAPQPPPAAAPQPPSPEQPAPSNRQIHLMGAPDLGETLAHHEHIGFIRGWNSAWSMPEHRPNERWADQA